MKEELQSTLNIGTIGHVDHGKTSLTAALSGVWADTHSEEQKRRITIKRGHAEVEFAKCKHCQIYTRDKKCPKCNSPVEVVKRVSLIDSPGHETLMATVIAASSIMDGALFVIAANEECPQPQTQEHLMALQAAGIKNVVIAQNKVDLVSKEQAKKNHKQIKDFLKGTEYENAPIIPTSANLGLNLSALIETLLTTITAKDRKSGKSTMYVVRSFDVNKPGSELDKLVGGVIGGSIVSGEFKVGDEVEVRPGVAKDKKDKIIYLPIKTKISSLQAGKNKLQSAHAGGLIAVGTTLDPALAKGDGLVGSVIGKPGELPDVLSEVIVEITPLVRQSEKFADTFVINEPLVLGIGTATTVGFVIAQKKNKIKLQLKKPVCVGKEDKIAIMRRSKTRWHLYATAKITV